jgi:hypothetical protein
MGSIALRSEGRRSRAARDAVFRSSLGCTCGRYAGRCGVITR